MTDPEHPPVSVIIATRDRPGLLERAVRHIFDQDYPGQIECLVVYDHVQVRPLEVEQPAGRRLVLLANARTPGLPGGRNTGCDAATGELVIASQVQPYKASNLQPAVQKVEDACSACHKQFRDH